MKNFTTNLIINILYYTVLLPSYLVSLLPSPLFLAIGSGIGKILEVIQFRKKIILDNLDLAFGNKLSKTEKAIFLKKHYRHLGILFFEILRNFSFDKKRASEMVIFPKEVTSKIDEVLRRGKGALILTGHFSNWELGGMAINALGYPIKVVVKQQSNPISQGLIERFRSRRQFEVIYSGGTLAKMEEHFKTGGCIGFLIDQHMPGNKGIRVNFMGTPASTIRGMAGLVKRTEVPVLPIFPVRNEKGIHEIHMLDEISYIHAHELPESSPERASKEEFLNTQAYSHAIEEMVKISQEKWLWIHRRWKADRTPLKEI